MNSEEIGGPAKPSAAEEVRTRIVAIAASASDEDKKRVREIVTNARTDKHSATVSTITAPMAAILFLDHNPRNRDWSASRGQEYARRMETGQWQFNQHAIGFYRDGTLEDGQHRLSGAALSGAPFTTVVVYGIEQRAVVTVDDGGVRHAADHAKLRGIADSKVKQSIVKSASAYLKKMGDKEAMLKSQAEIVHSMETNNAILDQAIEIGTATMPLRNPVFKLIPSATFAYLRLMHNWPSDRISSQLKLLQGNQSKDGGSSPAFVASSLIEAARLKRNVKERLTTVKELGIAIEALNAEERGVRALTANALKSSVKSAVPSPAYPDEQTEAPSEPRRPQRRSRPSDDAEAEAPA